jgi:hypothetical protein
LTTKFEVLLAVPAGVVTWIRPVVAPAGTVVEIWVGEITLNADAVTLNLTVVAPERFVPVTVTGVPGLPLDGNIPVTVGAAKRVAAEASFENAELPSAPWA